MLRRNAQHDAVGHGNASRDAFHAAFQHIRDFARCSSAWHQIDQASLFGYPRLTAQQDQEIAPASPSRINTSPR
jgi:hypothetical protein